MKEVTIRFFCDHCKKEITDEVKAMKIGSIGEQGTFVDDQPEDIRHYHDKCIGEIFKEKKTMKIDHGRIVALYTANPPRSIKWIADDVGCSVQTVINHLTKEGIYKNDIQKQGS